MPSSDYSTAVGGGLKLKGAKDGGVKKKKRKDKSKVEKGEQSEGTDSVTAAVAQEQSDDVVDGNTALQKALADEEQGEESGAKDEEVKDFGKTEAQKRYEERRRKRLDERLKKEGLKTHKQRVEELNKYLSNLSEHHDMPRIGPG